MPIYPLINEDTGEIFEKMMKISDYEQYLLDNPNIKRYFTTESIPKLCDPCRLMDGGAKSKPPADFQHGVIERMKNSIPGNTLSDRKYQIPREW